jgi:phytoene dehydrogenase-like protein
MRVAVIGAGLGGLLTASLLSESGYTVDVYEKLNFYGGRFTSFEYRGFQISTGALHMIPHGKRGPLGKLLKSVGSDVEIIDSKPEGEILLNDRIEVRSSAFPLKSKFKFFKWLLKYRVLRIDPYMDAYEKELDDVSAGFLRSFLGWSLSISPSQIKFSKLLAIYNRVVECGGPGIPVGGCKAVVDDLVEIIKSNGGSIRLRNPVIRLITNGNTIKKLESQKDVAEYDLFISNLGHKLTGRLAGREYFEHNGCESKGVKYSISISKPFIGNTGVLFPLNCSRISGMNEVTNADPSLAPKGKHLLMAHQPLFTDNIRKEIEEGLKELRTLLRGFDYEIIAVQSFHDDWPVNRIMSGLDRGYKTPFKNLFVVGDGAKGDDIEVDGIALGVAKLLKEKFSEKVPVRCRKCPK